MATFHSKALQSRPIFAADLAREVRKRLYPRRASAHILTEASLLQNFLLIVHILFDQALFIPSEEPQYNSGCFMWLFEQICDFGDLAVLVPLYVLGTVDFEINLVCLLTRLQIFLLCLKCRVFLQRLFYIDIRICR